MKSFDVIVFNPIRLNPLGLNAVEKQGGIVSSIPPYAF
jgi:hypothetical protein